MREQYVPGMEIVVPKQTSGQCETAPNQIKLPCVMNICGMRQSGKTVALVSELEKLPFDPSSGLVFQ
jgi:hypothetical protein